MLLSGRPLLDTKADERYFVNRSDEMEAAQRAVRHEINTLVVGPRGVGKTSFLRRLAYDIRAARTHMVEVVDGSVAPEPLALLTLVAERLVGPAVVTVPHESSIQATMQKIAGRTEARPSSPQRLLSVVDRLRAELPSDLDRVPADAHGPLWEPGNPAVVLLDDPSVAAAQVLFGQLRDELWTLPIVWIVSGDDVHRAEYLHGAADAFFESRVALGPMTHAAAVELVTRRLDRGAPSPFIERLVAMTDRTPRALVTVARTQGTKEGTSQESVAAEDARLDAARSALFALGRAAEMLVAEMQARGGVTSASDEGLLTALGWSRPRAVQVLRQLEDAGLVTSSLQRADGPGRPRKVYELIELVL
jgi:hypothetical protein